jgi:hypothetical protein
MHISVHRSRFSSQLHPAASTLAPDMSRRAIKPVSDRPDERRRQGDIWRRARSSVAPAAPPQEQTEAVVDAGVPPTAPSAVPSEFWALVSAVATRNFAGDLSTPAKTHPMPAPSFDALLAQALKPAT